MKFLPIFLNINNRPCLVVGGGDVAARKVTLLLRAGAAVTVVSPTLCQRLEYYLEEKKISYRNQTFEVGLLNEFVLVIAATDNKDLNQKISAGSHAQRIPVNVVDQPDLCSFIMPSIIDRSPVVVAVSTGGASPVLARLLRARLETLIPASYGQLATLVQKFRSQVKQKFKTIELRRRFWEHILQGPIAELMYSGRENAAKKALEKAVGDASLTISNRGEVYLVGAGPGDPDLLTFRALRLLQQSDVIIYDRLVSKEILDLARQDADRIYVGKERNKHTLPQEELSQLLARLAKEGKRVLRLKGGDPFIFGRGGEEIETLAEAGVSFQIVPGITAASGCAAYAGIPLTHRDYAQSVVFITGHLKDGTANLNWDTLVRPKQTIVFYMGLKGAEVIFHQLIKNGLPATTPTALIQKGTTKNQHVYIGTLETMPGIIQREPVQPPTIIIVGKVVTLHKKLSWFEQA